MNDPKMKSGYFNAGLLLTRKGTARAWRRETPRIAALLNRFAKDP